MMNKQLVLVGVALISLLASCLNLKGWMIVGVIIVVLGMIV